MFLNSDMRSSKISLDKNTSSSSLSYNKLTIGQQRLAKLMARDSEIIKNLILIQFYMLPHLEIIQKEESITHNILKKDTHFSHVEGFIDLVVELEI